MTLGSAQASASAALAAAFSSFVPKVYVEDYDGVFSLDEANKKGSATPKLLVSPLSVDNEGVKLAVYSLFRSTDRRQVEVLDLCVQALRGLGGSGRPPLSVSSRSLYDKDALKSSLRLWVHMVDWPHLAIGDDPLASGGPVAAEKQRIASIFSGTCPVAQSEQQLKALVLSSSLPFIGIQEGSGVFEKGEARTVKYSDADGKLYRRTVKGSATWPISIAAYAHSEAEAEGLLWPLLALLPNVSTQDGLNTTTLVVELHSGKGENGASVASVTVNLVVPVATQPERVAQFKNAVVTDTVISRRV